MVSFIFVVLGIWGGLKIEKSASREVGREPMRLFHPPEERSVPLRSVALLGNSKGFIKGLGNQGSSWNLNGGMVQKI